MYLAESCVLRAPSSRFGMIPAFQFALGHQVLQGLVTVGRYDGKRPCLSAGTTAGKVLIHCPHNRIENPQNEAGCGAVLWRAHLFWYMLLEYYLD